MSKTRWQILAAVCAAHGLLVGSFLSDSRSAVPAVGSVERLYVQLIKTPALQPYTHPVNAAQVPSRLNPLAPLPQVNAAVPQGHQRQETTQKPDAVTPTHDKFLDLEALDEPAVSSSDFEAALSQALPGRFEKVVLELFIDEAGRTVQVSCVEGDCSEALAEKLKRLLAVPFIPALKNGQTVASRKVLQISPIPTLGL